MAGEGKLLRETREGRGLTYTDIEKELKIRVSYLKALEDEAYDGLPGATYTKGFLRTYAKYLGLDGDQVIASYLASHEQETEELEIPQPISATPTLFRPAVILVVALLAIALLIGLSFFFRQDEQKPVEYIPAPLPVAPETTLPVVPETEAPVYEGLTVEVSFTERCWLEVLADGEIAFSGTKESGDTLLLEAEETVEFTSIGNRNGVEIKKNGEILPPPEGEGNVVKNYRLTLD